MICKRTFAQSEDKENHPPNNALPLPPKKVKLESTVLMQNHSSLLQSFPKPKTAIHYDAAELFPAVTSIKYSFVYLAHPKAIENYPNLLLFMELTYWMSYKLYSQQSNSSLIYGDIIVDGDSAIFICSSEQIESYSASIKHSDKFYKRILWIIYEQEIDNQVEETIKNC